MTKKTKADATAPEATPTALPTNEGAEVVTPATVATVALDPTLDAAPLPQSVKVSLPAPLPTFVDDKARHAVAAIPAEAATEVAGGIVQVNYL